MCGKRWNPWESLGNVWEDIDAPVIKCGWEIPRLKWWIFLCHVCHVCDVWLSKGG